MYSFYQSAFKISLENYAWIDQKKKNFQSFLLNLTLAIFCKYTDIGNGPTDASFPNNERSGIYRKDLNIFLAPHRTFLYVMDGPLNV